MGKYNTRPTGGMWPGKHTNHGAWGVCMRTQIRFNLDDQMIWEQGLLVGNRFSDTIAGGSFGLLGSRDADVARHIAQDTSDLQPHPLLSEPNMPDEDVYFDA